MFNDIKEGIQWIESIRRFGDKYDLSRMILACKLLGNPEQELPIIHIGGTNGKGSTLSYIKSILLEAGYHVGTFTSPYIVRFNERISLDGKEISDNELLHYINIIKELHDTVLNEYDEVITFFELITLISFLFFKDRKVDFCLYEVGLGGTLDATNVVTPLISIITTIGYDHMAVLGNTLESIARNKLGIVKNNVPLVTGIKQKELLGLFKEITEQKNSPLYIINHSKITDITPSDITTFNYKGIKYAIPLLGIHQVSNAVLAIETIEQLNSKNIISVQTNIIQSGLLKTSWPGRLEKIENIYLDGAHNIDGAIVLRDTIKTYFKDKYVKVLYTSMSDKAYSEIIKIIETFADEIYFTSFDYPRCEDANVLYEHSSHTLKFVEENAKKALQKLKNLKDNEILLITGSLYFVSYLRKELL
jgi:dihydrofolate synthase/folylpolyglutamate synthase